MLYGMVKKLPKHMKEQISEKVKALWEDEEYRNNQIEKMKGRKLPEETKIKMSKTHKQLWEDDKYREKCLENFAIPHEDTEVRERRIANITKAWQNEDLRQRMSELNSGEGNPFFGQTHTEETKKKIS